MTEATKFGLQPVLSFEEMLAADAYEVERWHKHFQAHPALFELPTQIAGAGTLGGLLLHIAGVQLRYSYWLLDWPLPNLDKIAATIDGVFAAMQEARSNLRLFLTRATPEMLAQILEFRRDDFHLRCTRRKAFAQAILHGDRHWAQLAVAVREAGHPTDWIHDFVFSPAME